MIPLAQQLAEISHICQLKSLKYHHSAVALNFSDKTISDIYSCIKNRPMVINDIAKKSGYSHDTVRKVCRRLAGEGKIENVGGYGGGPTGKYAFVRMRADRTKMEPVTLGQKLAAARKAKKLGQAAAADMLGISREYLCRLERDKSPKPQPYVVLALNKLYGLNLGDEL
jgi:DNA-binding XRE family transcriptional regulator